MTSEYEELDECIVEFYRGFWKIEKSFKVTKSDLETRPIYLSREDHIEIHLLTCFVSLVIARLFSKSLKGKYSITMIIESLEKASYSHIQGNYYLLDFYSDVLDDIKKELAIDLRKKCMSLKEINKVLGTTKIE